jgi:SAM-dependent methyltransferase
MLDELRNLARRSDRLRAAAGSARQARRRITDAAALTDYVRGKAAFSALPEPVAIRIAYDVLLDREADQHGVDTFVRWLEGPMTTREMVATILGSDEFALSAFRALGPSLHFSRGAFVRTLPPARRILDLGGSSAYAAGGALVSFGYPYAFDELVIVELPADERHQHYRHVLEADRIETPLGPVAFRYHSMTDLGGLADGSFDLVYSGQSIEHVTEAEADKVLAEVRRVLRPGGILALDTPNGPVCRLHEAEFIDPDHEIEYSHAEFSAKLEQAGLRIVRRHGLNHAGPSVAAGRFDTVDTARRWGLFDDIERCYLLAYVCTPDG